MTKAGCKENKFPKDMPRAKKWANPRHTCGSNKQQWDTFADVYRAASVWLEKNEKHTWRQKVKRQRKESTK